MGDKKEVQKRTISSKIGEVDFNKFLDLEHKRIDIEKLREENVARELEASRDSNKDALEMAKEELAIHTTFIGKSFSFKKMISIMVFILLIIILSGGIFLTFYLSKNNIVVLDKLFSLIKDILKITTGFVLGFAADVIRTKNKKDKE